MKNTYILLLVLIGLSVHTHAITRYVTPTGSGSLNGSSWLNAYPGTSLQVAINASGTNDEVWVASGLYYPTTTSSRTISFNMKNSVAIYGSFVGTETLLSQRTLTNGITTILSGNIGTAANSDNSYKVIYNTSLNSSAVIDGFIVEGGNDNRSPNTTGNGLGGGIYNHGYGSGGICNPTIRNCLFRNNSASWGAGAFNNGYANGNTTPTYINCVFYQNHATIEAGGMDSYGVGGNASPTLYNCIFDSNTSATNVGAMYCWGGNANGNSNPLLVNCVFVNNVAQNGYCGAVISSNLDENNTTSSGTSTVTMQNCIVYNNSATGAGPQFYVRGTGANIRATYSNIDLTGQNSPHILSGAVTGNINTPPQFVNMASGMGPDNNWMTSDDGLQLQSASPCINTGNNSNVHSTDLLSNTRIINSTVDMGAYEFFSTSTSVNKSSLNNLDVKFFPNPTTKFININFSLLETTNINLFLYDLRGKKRINIGLGQRTSGDNTYQVDLSLLETGTYFLILKTKTDELGSKIILTN